MFIHRGARNHARSQVSCLDYMLSTLRHSSAKLSYHFVQLMTVAGPPADIFAAIGGAHFASMEVQPSQRRKHANQVRLKAGCARVRRQTDLKYFNTVSFVLAFWCMSDTDRQLDHLTISNRPISSSYRYTIHCHRHALFWVRDAPSVVPVTLDHEVKCVLIRTSSGSMSLDDYEQ